MKKEWYLLLLLCCMLFFSVSVKAASVDVSAEPEGNGITVRINSSVKDVNYVDVIVTGGGQWRHHHKVSLTGGKRRIYLSDLKPDTEYMIEVCPYHENGNLSDSSDNVRYEEYDITIKICTERTLSGKIYKGETNVGKAVYTDFLEGKNGSYLVKIKNRKLNLKKVKNEVYRVDNGRLGTILRSYMPIHLTSHYLYQEDGYRYYSVKGECNIGRAKLKRMHKAMKKADLIVKKLGSQLRGKSRRRKAAVLYDYLAKHCKYSLSASYCGSSYGALCKGCAKCSGYAEGYALLCAKADIPCVIVSGSNHAYNGVEIGKKIYFCDITYDDHDNGKRASRKYFMKGSGSRFFRISGHEKPMALRSLKKWKGISHKIAK